MLRANSVPVKMNKFSLPSWPENCDKKEKNWGSVETKLRKKSNLIATREKDYGLS